MYDYEDSFDHEMMQKTRPGYTVWDVGANVGYYVERVGLQGKVGAFEPSPDSADQLHAKYGPISNVTLERIALSDEDGESHFYTSDNDVTDGLFSSDDKQRDTVTVQVLRGDNYTGNAPNLIKIDVEGYEYEVLKGMTQLLQSEKLRVIFIEVHFQILAERNLKHAAKEIVSMMENAGFRVTWLDPSHVMGSKET